MLRWRILTYFALLLTFSASFCATYAQIPNSDFEKWTNEFPDDWAIHHPYRGQIWKTTDAQSGSFAAEGIPRRLSAPGYPFLGYAAIGMTSSKFRVEYDYSVLRGYYKFFPQQGDVLQISIILFKDGNQVGFGESILDKTVTRYSPFEVKINYGQLRAQPDTAFIIIRITDPTRPWGAHHDSRMFIDNLSFDSITKVERENFTVATNSSLNQNYPNPYNSSTIISYNVNEEGEVKLEVYNRLGQQLATLVNENQQRGYHAVQFNGAGLSSGIYFYTLSLRGRSGTVRSLTKAMMFIK